MGETESVLLGIIVIGMIWIGWPLFRIATALEALQKLAGNGRP